MIYSSSIVDDQTPLVLDTSVLINLNASSVGSKILSALSNTVLIPQMVVNEVNRQTSRANGEIELIQDLIRKGKIQVVELNDEEAEIFEKLVSGVRSLGDGEAATIAIASARGYLPIIDERKGRQEAVTLIPGGTPGWSLDLLRHPKVLKELGEPQATRALYLALRDGRMRIHEDHSEEVVNLIGVKRALDCNSLPGYKLKKQQWMGP